MEKKRKGEGTMAGKIKIAFFDVDGTLIDMDRKKITPNTVAALRGLQARGVKLCIASGRSPMLIPKIEGIEFDALLAYNGAYCYTGDRVIHSSPLNRHDVQAILRNAAALGRPVCAATKDRLSLNGMDADLRTYFGFGSFVPEPDPEFDRVVQGEIYQLMLSCHPQEYGQILESTENAKMAAWWDRAADVIPADSGKGAGVRAVLKFFGLTREEAIAFGDGDNDLEMLRAVGTGVAMGNASAALKAVAADTCGGVKEDGIYHYCLEKGLISGAL